MAQAVIARTGTSPSASAGSVSDPPAGGKARDPLFDNAKYIAILLVVVGHAMGPLGAPVPRAADLWIYLFHMPVFIFIAGYFTRSFDYSPRKMRRLIEGVVAPYVVFNIAYALFMRFVAGYDRQGIDLLNPYWLTWFLAALFIWRMSSGIWRQVRFPVAVAVVISLGVGLVPVTHKLAIARVLAMLPFFVLGMTVRPEHLQLLRRPLVRVLAVVTFVCAFAVAYVVGPHMDNEWVFWSQSYAHFNVSALVGLGVRAGLLVCSVALVASFLALVPRRRAWFTALGASSVFAYLLHGFFYKFATSHHWYAHAHSLLGTVVVVVAAAALGTLLMTPPVRKAFGWAVEPTLGWAFRRDRSIDRDTGASERLRHKTTAC